MLKRQTIELLSLALPIMIETVLQTLLGTTDAYFAGQLTDAAISGISVTNVVMNIFISFSCVLRVLNRLGVPEFLPLSFPEPRRLRLYVQIDRVFSKTYG